jgi:hypothetical protein
MQKAARNGEPPWNAVKVRQSISKANVSPRGTTLGQALIRVGPGFEDAADR